MTDLKDVRSFPQLVKYLRDELEWPISTDDFEDLVFNFTPEELGIDVRNAAKIQDIKRLRPLSVHQPWGVFFVKFEPKRLPVVALRRILSAVALKKRPSSGKSDQPAWTAEDLLFISNYGDGDTRQISFAHFSQDSDVEKLPTLRVMGWDNLDTLLHLNDVAVRLHDHLVWPKDESDADAWRKNWASAFTLRHREVINSSSALSTRLASLARAIRDRIGTALAVESESGALTQLMSGFRETLVHDLDRDGFADMYAQTIAYGLLSARIADPKGVTAHEEGDQIPVTNPFLKELMETFLHLGGRRGTEGGPGIDFDELGVSEVVALLDNTNMEAVVQEFGDRNPEDDPVIHFYERFLSAYDKDQKVSRGVFYTPRPIVSFIVRAIDDLLREEFGLEDGLADITTWGEIVERSGRFQIPSGVAPTQCFVQILDPATGTGTFLVEVIDLIHQTMVGRWESQGHSATTIEELWNEYVPDHLLTRLFGYELLMAPYAIAHLKIGLKLRETGYKFRGSQRAQIYLTNALLPAEDLSGRLKTTLPALAHEAQAVNRVKKDQRFTVVLGNPPYSKLSANLSKDARDLVDVYKFVDGTRIREKGALQFEMNLQDDYVKFVRLAQMAIDEAGSGCIGLITNSGYLGNPTLRGMRYSLCESFSSAHVVDLHGRPQPRRSADAEKDENVFDIQQAVAIGLYCRNPEAPPPPAVSYYSLVGSRKSKTDTLISGHVSDYQGAAVKLDSPLYRFVPFDSSLQLEFESMTSLPELFPRNSAGFISSRDGLVVGTSEKALEESMRQFGADSRDAETIYASYGFKPSKRFDLRSAQATVRQDPELVKRIIPCLYRPFDSRWVYYKRELIESFKPIAKEMTDINNLAILATRQVTGGQFQHAFVSRFMVEIKVCSHDRNTQIFPLQVGAANDDSMLSSEGPIPNLSPARLGELAKSTALTFQASDEPSSGEVFNPRDVLHYAYAILYSPNYRRRYLDFLRTDFPRIPTSVSNELFRSLSRLGQELVSVHLLEAPQLERHVTTYVGPANPRVGRVGWADGTVWLDVNAARRQTHAAGNAGFDGVAEEVWNFQVGGYQVCHKWLKDRRDQSLTEDEVERYQGIVVAIAETIRLQEQINRVIEEHGGWPKAFAAG